jgi:hypothetical protein
MIVAAQGNQADTSNPAPVAAEVLITPAEIRRRAEMTAARTSRIEVSASIGGGQNVVREKLPSFVGSRWKTKEDTRVRPAHRKAHNQIAPAGRMFVVGGEYCEYPHDPRLSPENREGCRCWTEGVYR